jgi:4-amino-4-deoxy-L-arabinose transferase-like glycosyltransferase
MPAEPQLENQQSLPWRWLLLTLALVAARAIPNLRFPIGRDQATCCVIAQRMLEGLHLYRDLLDNRPPGIFWLYAPFVKVLGAVMWIAALADLLVVLATAAVLFLLARRFLGNAAAAIGTVAAASFHCSSGYVSAAQPDGLLMVFLFSASLLMLSRARSSAWLAGVAFAAAFWVKYNALAFFPWTVLVGWLDWAALDLPNPRLRLKESLRESLIVLSKLAGGFAAVSALVLGWFLLGGSWASFRESQFDVLVHYGATSLEQRAHGAWALGDLYYFVGPWNYVGAALALTVAWVRREIAKVGPAALGLLAGMAAILLPGKLHSYYAEMILPFFGLAWGYLLVAAWTFFRRAAEWLRARGFQVARGLAWVVFANLLFAAGFAEGLRVVLDFQSFADWLCDPHSFYANYFPQHKLEKLADQLKVIEYLKTHSSADDEVYVWGTAPLINFLSERRSPTRFVSNLGLISPWGPAHWREELVEGLNANPPLHIVVARRDAIPTVSQSDLDSEQKLAAFPALAELMARRYAPCERSTNFTVYRRK